jgi:hypothetical protein
MHVEAVYRTEVEKLAQPSEDSLRNVPIGALRAWMLLFVITLRPQIIAPALNAYVGGP